MTMLQGVSLIHELADRYQILNEIGSGGMGMVYRAHDRALERPVAIKILATDQVRQPQVFARLRKEAMSAAQLHHPNIALIYDFGQADDTAFIAMEYIEGVSLRQLLDVRPLPMARAMHILDQIGQALEHAHGLGITHRDVKPSNILISTRSVGRISGRTGAPYADRDGDHATLIDFGLADAPDASRTLDYGAFGTPAYMSPEQASGRGCDARSDQYALAVVAYEMLTGKTPFAERNATAILHAQVYELPPPPTEKNPSLPTAVNAVLLRALAKRPEDRYPSSAAFVDALQLACAPIPVAVRKSQRRLHWAGLLLLALVGIVAGGWWAIRVGQRANSTAAMALPTKVMWAHTPEHISKAVPVRAGNSIIVGMVNGAVLSLRADDGHLVWRMGGDDNALGAPAADRNLIYVGGADMVVGLSPPSGGTVWRTRVSGTVSLAPLLMNDRLVAITERGYIYLLYAGNGEVIWSRPLNEEITAYSVVQDWLFITAGRSLYALDVRNGMLQWSHRNVSRFSTTPVLAGDIILVATERGVLHGFDVVKGHERSRLALRGLTSTDPVVSDEVIYVADEAGNLSALGRADGVERWHFGAGASIAASPLLVGDKLMVGATNGALYILDARTGQLMDTRMFGGAISAKPLYVDGVVYVIADRVYALKP